ncbi:MAG: hypothetical protein JNK48_30995 [Bryobacterales bacterium]|nr:hypothetical protein [Bryobacterales bacterium]
MGFALWKKDGLCWAMGTHEYRPMGVAVISATDYFRARDFRPGGEAPSRDRSAFLGFYASIPHLNERIRAGKKPRRAGQAMDLL